MSVNSRINVALFLLCSAAIYACLLLLDGFAADDRATLQFVLSDADQAPLENGFAREGRARVPVFIAVHGQGQRPSQSRLNRIKAELLNIDGVSTGLPSLTLDLPERVQTDERIDLIVLLLDANEQGLETQRRIARSIHDVLVRILTADEQAYVVGSPQIRTASWEVAVSDMKFVGPALLVAVGTVSLVMFSTLTAALMSLFVAVLTTLACLFFYSLFSDTLNPMQLFLLPFIWSVATLDVYHLFDRAGRRAGQGVINAAERARFELWRACALTTLTTVLCLTTLLLADPPPLLVFYAIWGAIGCTLAYLFTFTLATRLLDCYSFRFERPHLKHNLARKLVLYARLRPRRVLAGWGILLVLALVFLPGLHVGSPFPAAFSEHVPIARDIEQLQRLSGTDLRPVDLLLTPADTEGNDTRALFYALASLSHYLKSFDETVFVLPADLVKKDEMSVQYSRGRDVLLNSDAASYWLSAGRRSARLQWYVRDMDHTRRQQLMDWIRHFDLTMLSHHELVLDGPGYLYYRAEKHGLASLLTGGVVSLLLVSVTLAWLSRSVTMTLLALAGNLLPCIILAGLMSALSIPWSIALLPLPIVLIGLMVDDTIHLLWPQRVAAGNRCYRFSVGARNSGHALLATTVVLSTCIATLLFSGIGVNRDIGILLPLGLLLALLSDLTFLPALSCWLRRSVR